MRRILNKKEEILNKLTNEDNREEVAYWRKFNELHEWFCDNFEVENCEYIEVTKEELEELYNYLSVFIDGDNSEDFAEDLIKLKKVLDTAITQINKMKEKYKELSSLSEQERIRYLERLKILNKLK